MQFALKSKSLRNWLGHVQSVETSCDELDNVDLSEQSWSQLICYASYKLHSHNFKE